MTRSQIKAVCELLLLLLDFALILTCSALHFTRGQVKHGMLQGAITLVLFYIAGFISNFFHLIRHELLRMPQRRGWKKVKPILILFIPCSYLLLWSGKMCKLYDSLTIKCWTASLKLFYCSTGSLVQAVFQSYLVVHMWWVLDIANYHYYTVMVAAIILLCHATYGVCDYIQVQYYDETNNQLQAKDVGLIVFAVFLNMSARVAAMSIVMGTLGWYWLAVAVTCPFLLNFAIYCFKSGRRDSSLCHTICHYINLIPLAFLTTMTVSEHRILTVCTTLAWLASFLPQIFYFHEDASNWVVWLVPTVAQIIAVAVMNIRWHVFEMAFHRFTRVAQNDTWITVPTAPQRQPEEN